MLLLGFTAEEDYSGAFWDKAEECPGFYVINREIGKAVSGKDFFINNDDGKPERLPGVNYSDFLYYYNLWENFHYFGLPHGAGWITERQWLLDFLKKFENAYKRIEMFLESKAKNENQDFLNNG